MRFSNECIWLAQEDAKNTIEHEGVAFVLRPIKAAVRQSKGGNSSVFTLTDPNVDLPDRAIKICNVPGPTSAMNARQRHRYGRFINEIEALRKASDEGYERVVSIHGDGIITMDQQEFTYYIMEKADTDLKDYLLSGENEIDNQERIKLCRDIFQSLMQLHSIDLYHRDIKPDNVFLFKTGEGTYIWKLGDLGLVDSGKRDYDNIRERIGPFGWASPEVMNKFLTEGLNFSFDCQIDAMSDVFQLGKLFWFIFQCNVPIGQIEERDFICENREKSRIFNMIKRMVQYAKNRRISDAELAGEIAVLASSFAV
jgi:serine/threonine protein kinase